MQKPNGYDSAESKSMDFSSPEAGAYICGIISVQDTVSRSGQSMLVLSLDIIEGEFTNHYRNYSKSADKDKLLKVYKVYGTEQSIPYFKGMITAIEKSNNGFKFDFNEQSLRGKKVGCILYEEEYYKDDGSIGVAIKPSHLCSIDSVRNEKFSIPKRKTVGSNNNQSGSFNNESSSRKQPDDDLPF